MDRKELRNLDCSESLHDCNDFGSSHVERQDNSRDSKSESDDSSEGEDFDHKWEELRNEALDTDDITHRIAVCNMDWDKIRAVDLFVCFNSFKPANGSINSVKIYPSDFGQKRMDEEKLKGPIALKTRPIDEQVDVKRRSIYHREKLRQYQLTRLKYFYAVVDCDSSETANVIYEHLNGLEYESSSVRFDLRFIPDDDTFDKEPASVASEVPSDYKPRFFVTSALQQVKVDLTWDQTDPKRREFFEKAFADNDSVQDEIGQYLASPSSESESEDMLEDKPDEKLKHKRAKYTELLKSIEEKEKQEKEAKIYDVLFREPKCKVKKESVKDSLNPCKELLLKKKELKHIQVIGTHSDEESIEVSQNEKGNSNKKLAELALISNSKKQTESEDNITKMKKEKCDYLDDSVADMNDPRFSAMPLVPSQQAKKNDGNLGLKHKEKHLKKKSRLH